MDLKIETMTCGGCARSVAKAIQSIDPCAKVETNPAARSAKVETAATQAMLLQVLEDAGFPATVN
jgi:copper chaperone